MKRTRMAGAVVGVALLAAASVAVAGNREDSETVAPLAEHVRSSAGGYQVQVHPAFSSGITVRTDAGDTQVYRQQGTYNLPGGAMEPPAQHVVRVQGGRFDRDVGLVVSDPKHQIARITVEMYDPTGQVGTERQVVERVVVDNYAKVCPPFCGPTGGN